MEYVLPENTSIKDAASIYGKLAELLVSVEETIIIDTSHVARMDTPIVQLLAIVNEAIVCSKRKIHWGEPSEAFISTIHLLGLSECFDFNNLIAEKKLLQ